MIDLVVTLVAMLVSPDVADGLRSTAPNDVRDAGAARRHVASAVVAGALTSTDPSMLLSIAHHESRYTDERTSELGGRVSCGVMTPTPLRACPREISFAQGYLDGARHLRVWLDACRGDETCALFGYAGGWRLIDACRHGGPKCYAPSVFRARALWIRRALAGPKVSS